MKYKFNPISQEMDLVVSNAGEITLGTPSDGDWGDGLLSFTSNTKTNDAIDEINEVLSEIAPADAESLNGKDLTIYNNTTVKYSGRLSDGNDYYKPSDPAGSFVNYIIKDGNFNLNSPEQDVCFNKADQGVLKVYINDNLVDSFDLASHFDEDYRDGDQVYPPADSPNGYITVTYVGKYNNFKKWQKGNCRVNINNTDLRQGYNYIKLVHEVGSEVQETNIWELFYDNDTGSNPYCSTPTLTEKYKVVKYLSGIQFYTINSEFYLSVTGYNLFNNVYYDPPIYYDYLPGLSSGSISVNDSSVSGVSSPPKIGETMTVSNKVLTLTVTNRRSSNARIRVRPRDPYGYYSYVYSASENRLIDTYNETSTDKYEYFDDERYRLPSSYDFESTTSPITNQWDSTTPLTNGNAQVFNGNLYYPHINFETGYLPSQQSGTDYSSFSGNQVYYRAFQDLGNPHNSGTLEFGGLTSGDISPVGSGNINVEIKLPGQTGWLDLGKPYDAGSFTGADGDGCRTGQVSNRWSWTSGTFSTADSGYRYYIRITLRNNTKYISHVKEVGW